MSYQLFQPRRTSRRLPARNTGAPVPYYPLPDYSLVPLSEAQPAPDHTLRNFIIGAVVVLALIAFLYWLNQRSTRPVRRNSRRPSKQSTAVMARNLYKRLETRGGANETTMRSLRQLSRGT